MSDEEAVQEVYSSKTVIAVGKSLKRPILSAKVSKKYMIMYFKQVEGEKYESQYRWKNEKKWKKQSNLKGKIKKRIKKRIYAKGFQVRIRSYTKINGKKIYSKWSAPLKIK